VLSKRLRRLTQLDQGLGAAIASLSEQVGEMQSALNQSKAGIDERTDVLRALTERADKAAIGLRSAIDTSEPPEVEEEDAAGLLRVDVKPPETATDPDSNSRPASGGTLDPERLAEILAKTGQVDAEPGRALEKLLQALQSEIGEARP
ncbi:MAG: hypothetical protein AAF317_04845, partial [Pseudomonadota bacterium]